MTSPLKNLVGSLWEHALCLLELFAWLHGVHRDPLLRVSYMAASTVRDVKPDNLSSKPCIRAKCWRSLRLQAAWLAYFRSMQDNGFDAHTPIYVASGLLTYLDSNGALSESVLESVIVAAALVNQYQEQGPR